ncbi:XRE family transcriptional regulator [Leekyejoonella antrihumi]|uniref:XRE family transcriptional regulator n=1 Tax=Leekyejoonella antrihumi TaxID=1660198 RepID=A0A563E7Q6_9MICO|nr:XRE family transcriptional regulator [Leekyejoonella antrihumi]TWP38547.1 XRE family transcriptional regulator [Leekyejoonella antrihumi]
MNEVREMRYAAGLTQAALAQRSGVAQPNIASYENGQRRPSATMLRRLRDAAKPRPSSMLTLHRMEVLAAARRHKATDVRVFGSIARDQDVSGSDVDLLVRFASDADVFDLADLTVELEELLGVSVDIVSEGGLRPDAQGIASQAVPL